VTLQYVSLTSFNISYFFLIQASVGRVSFTLDIWSDQRCGAYLAITAHWIANVEGTTALGFKTALIAFHRLHRRHDGRAIARTVIHLLDRAGVTVKVRRPYSQDARS
jgi:hypothetical protein